MHECSLKKSSNDLKDWKVVEQAPESAESNMDSDLMRLLKISPLAHPSLRFYGWKNPSATYGYFTNPWDYLDPLGVESEGVSLARRPTGGGVIFHGFDLAFSVLIPSSSGVYSTNTLENYAFVNAKIAAALKDYDISLEPDFAKCCSQGKKAKPQFCMAETTVYDVLIKGKKVAGGAQRRTREGFLHQGSICLKLPPEPFLRKVLQKNTSFYERITQLSYPLFHQCGLNEFEERLNLLKRKLISSFTGS